MYDVLSSKMLKCFKKILKHSATFLHHT